MDRLERAILRCNARYRAWASLAPVDAAWVRGTKPRLWMRCRACGFTESSGVVFGSLRKAEAMLVVRLTRRGCGHFAQLKGREKDIAEIAALELLAGDSAP
jgi:hypothetical protein